jgi:hypothetical protein
MGALNPAAGESVKMRSATMKGAAKFLCFTIPPDQAGAVDFCRISFVCALYFEGVALTSDPRASSAHFEANIGHARRLEDPHVTSTSLCESVRRAPRGCRMIFARIELDQLKELAAGFHQSAGNPVGARGG